MWHGNGGLTFSVGDVYKGEFREDKREGKRTYTFSDGSVYVGDFKNDYRNGQGKMKYENAVYEGSWRKNWPRIRMVLFSKGSF